MPLPPHCSHFTRFLWCSNVSDTRWGASLRCYNDNYICTDGKRCMNPIKMRLHRWMRPRVWIAYSSRSFFFALLVNLWVWFALFPCSHKIFFGNSPFEFIRLFALEGYNTNIFRSIFFLSYSIVFFLFGLVRFGFRWCRSTPSRQRWSSSVLSNASTNSSETSKKRKTR